MITKYFSTLKKPKIVVIDSNDDKLKVLQLMKKSVFRKSILVVGTHNGIFHSDEVVACAMLYLTGGFKEIWIIRTRDEEILKKCDICVDVGGGVYDHHTEKKFRSNGKIYASAGLVWNDFGRSLLKKTLMKYFSEFKVDLAVAFKTFDEEIIQVVDYEDNGVPCDRQNPFNYITAFHPRWDKTSPQDFNRQFKKVLEITISVLEEQLKDCLSRVYSKATLLEQIPVSQKESEAIVNAINHELETSSNCKVDGLACMCCNCNFSGRNICFNGIVQELVSYRLQNDGVNAQNAHFFLNNLK